LLIKISFVFDKKVITNRKASSDIRVTFFVNFIYHAVNELCNKSGGALRSPGIKRWRKDKKPDEINTLEDLKKMLATYGK